MSQTKITIENTVPKSRIGETLTYTAICPNCFGNRTLQSEFVLLNDEVVSVSRSKPCRHCGYGK